MAMIKPRNRVSNSAAPTEGNLGNENTKGNTDRKVRRTSMMPVSRSERGLLKMGVKIGLEYYSEQIKKWVVKCSETDRSFRNVKRNAMETFKFPLRQFKFYYDVLSGLDLRYHFRLIPRIWQAFKHRLASDYYKVFQRKYFYRLNTSLLQYQTFMHTHGEDIIQLMNSKNRVEENVIIDALNSFQDSFNIPIPDWRDPTGANIIHVAFFAESYQIGWLLIDRFPTLAAEVFDSESHMLHHDLFKSNPAFEDLRNKFRLPYSGGNILHMTIVRRDYQQTQRILEYFYNADIGKYSLPERSKLDISNTSIYKLLTSNARGSFFEEGSMNFGSYPLHFAVCSNERSIFDLVFLYTIKVIGHGAIFWRDNHGNTIYHLCIIHKLKKMSEHVIRKCSKALSDEMIRQALICCSLGPFASSLNGSKSRIIIKYIPEPSMSSVSNTSDGNVKFSLSEGPSFVAKAPNLKEFDQDHVFKIPRPLLTGADRKNFKMNISSWADYHTQAILMTRFFLVLNDQYLSPLTLAAFGSGVNVKGNAEDGVSKKEMLALLLIQLKQSNWNLGPMQYEYINVVGLEMPLDHRQYVESEEVEMNCKSVIQILCELESTDCIMIPDIELIINTKWDSFGKERFNRYCALNFVTTIMLTFLSCFINFTPDGSAGIWNPFNGTCVVNTLYPITSMLLLYLAVNEFVLILKYGLDYWGFIGSSKAVRGAAQFDKLCRTVLLSSFAALCSYKVRNRGNVFFTSAMSHDTIQDMDTQSSLSFYSVKDYDGVKISMTICLLSSYIYLYYFLMGYDYTGPFVLTMAKICIRNIPFFLMFYFFVLMGFACAIAVLSNRGSEDIYYGIEHLLAVTWNLIKQTVQLQNFHERDAYDFYDPPEHLIWLLDFIQTAFNFTVALLMLNLLIALVNDTYDELKRNKSALLLIEKFNIMHGMERSVFGDDKQSIRDMYTAIVPNPYSFKDMSTQRLTNTSIDFKDSFLGSGKPALERKLSIDTDLPSMVEEHSFVFFEKLDTKKDFMKFIDSSMPKENDKVILVVIDPQVDFFKDSRYPKAKLPCVDSTGIPRRISSMIEANPDLISKIYVSTTSHDRYHISHTSFWRKNNDTKSPDPFTVIKVTEPGHMLPIKVWYPLDEKADEWTNIYINQLERLVKPPLTVFPGHCVKSNVSHSPLFWKRVNSGNTAIFNEATDSTKAWIPITHESDTIEWISNQPEPFTVITEAELNKVWAPINETPSVIEWVKKYIRDLKDRGEPGIVIWPPEFTTPSKPITISNFDRSGTYEDEGHKIHPAIDGALNYWERFNIYGHKVEYIDKCRNWRSESHSIFRADVEIASDPSSHFKDTLMQEFKSASKVIICGQSSSHSIAATVRDMIDNWNEDHLNKIHVLEDGCSYIEGFKDSSVEFFELCREKGITLTTTYNVFPTQRGRDDYDEPDFMDLVSSYASATGDIPDEENEKVADVADDLAALKSAQKSALRYPVGTRDKNGGSNSNSASSDGNQSD